MQQEKIIEEILVIIEPFLSKNKQKINVPYELAFHHLLERVGWNIKSLSLLIRKDIIKHDHVIGLILRNMISDFLISGFIILTSKSKNEVIDKLYSLYNADIKKVGSFLKMIMKAGLFSEEEFKKYENNYKEIRDYCDKNKPEKIPTISGIIELILKSELKDHWFKEIKNSYDTWVFYSKYEHFGWFSYETTRNIDKTKTINTINSVLRMTTTLIGSCLEILGEKKAMKESIKLMEKCYRAEKL